MKKHILLLAAAAALAACSKEQPKDKPWLDPDAKVYIKPAGAAATAKGGDANPEHLTPLEVVKRAKYMVGNYPQMGVVGAHAMLDDRHRDTVSDPPALLRFASDIITNCHTTFGCELVRDFIDMRDIAITLGDRINSADTIAYIPNRNMVEATAIIEAAWAAQDTAAIYPVFQNAFTFIPITGPELRELIRQGLN